MEQELNIDFLLGDIEYRKKILDTDFQKLDKKMELYTNQSDKYDYMFSIGSGLISCTIDCFLSKKYDFADYKNWGEKQVNSFVKKIGKSPNLKKAISNLEKRTKTSFISDANIDDFGGGLQHHLRDFNHHPSLIGLICNIFSQFSGICIGTDTAGKICTFPAKDLSRMGLSFRQKIEYGTIEWFLHLVSDMSGSTSSVGKGTGIPGPILSTAKELSSIPPFNKMKIGDKTISEFISKIFNGTLFAEKDENGKLIRDTVIGFDFRTELALIEKQSISVIINEVLIRMYYAVRRFIDEAKSATINEFKDIYKLNWRKIAPFNNATIVRMREISCGVYTVTNLSFSTIYAIITSKGSKIEFFKQLIRSINLVMIADALYSVGCDISMIFKRKKINFEIFGIKEQYFNISNLQSELKQYVLLTDLLKSNDLTIVSQEENDLINSLRKIYCDNLNEDIKRKINELNENDKSELLGALN